MKRFTAILLSIFTVFALTACQPTPEAAVVVRKDFDILIERAAGSNVFGSENLSERYNIPKHITKELEGIGGKLSVSIDAAITIPIESTLSVYRVTPADFTQEQVDKIISALYDGNALHTVDSTWTKLDIERMITDMRQHLSDTYTDEGKEHFNQQIEMLEKMYETAPNEKVEPPSDGTLMTKQINNPLTGKPMDEYTYLDVEDEQGRRLYIRNNSSGSEYITVESDTGGNEVFDASSRGAMLNFGNTTCIYEIADITLGDSEGLSAKKLFECSPEQAMAVAQQFVSAIGAEYMRPWKIHIVSDIPKEDSDMWDSWFLSLTKRDWAYRISFVRTLNGAEVTADTLTSSSDYGRGWTYEYMHITVDGSGIRHFVWQSPYEILETAVTDAALLDFARIQEIFEKMIFIIRDSRFDSEEIVNARYDVDKILLSLQRINEQDSAENGLLIPVWTFYGDSTFHYANGHSSTKTEQVFLTINAIDGSIIDRALGY